MIKKTKRLLIASALLFSFALIGTSTQANAAPSEPGQLEGHYNCYPVYDYWGYYLYDDCYWEYY